MVWYLKLFGKQISQSAFFGQINQIALGQPWVGRESNKVKILQK